MRKRFLKVKLFLLFCSLVGTVNANSTTEKSTVEATVKDSTLISVPYTSLKKSDFSGAVEVISGAVIEDVPVQHLSNALTGRLPGLYTIQSTGEPGGDQASMYIRGRRTNGEGVLVLVDGQERSFGMIQPQEIESITLLKDASASVLYGMRAANGVLLIKTKTGQDGKPRVSLNAQAVYQQNMRSLEALNASQYGQYYNEALINDGIAPFYTESQLGKFADQSDPERFPDVDWMGQLLKKGSWLQRYNVTVDGGFKRTRYFVSLGTNFQSGMFNTDNEQNYSTNTNFSRYNFRSNVEFDVTKTTLLTAKIDGWMEDRNYPFGEDAQRTIFKTLLRTTPTAFPMYYKDNHGYVDQSGNPLKPQIGDKIVTGNDIYKNPWAMLNRAGYVVKNTRYGAFTLALDQDLSFLLSGLSVHGQVAMDVWNTQNTLRKINYNYYKLLDGNVLQKWGNSDEMLGNSTQVYAPKRLTSLNFNVKYNKSFGKHNVSGMLLYDQYELAQDIVLPWRYQSFGGCFSYNFDQRYQADIAFNYQGTYKLSPDNRWGVSPALSLAWNASNEKFFDAVKPYVSYLKIRGSIGQVNSDRAVTAYDYMSRLQQVDNLAYFGNNMGGVNGLLETMQGNPLATYEKALQMNLGIDAGFFSNRLNASLDLWQDHRKDVYTVPATFSGLLGFTSMYLPKQNVGEIKSKGMEVSASWNDNIGDFSYHIGGNVSFSKSEVINMDEVPQAYSYLYQKGYALGTPLLYIADGVFNTWEEIAAAPEHTLASVSPGDIRYKDINNDGKIDENDRVRYGYGEIPQVFYGIDLGVSYKGFSVSALLQGAANVTKSINYHAAYAFYDNGKIFEHQLNRWTPENKVNAPKFTTQSTGTVNNNLSSTYWTRDASYLRLKNVEIAYSLPKKAAKSLLLEELRFFVTGQNLLTFDKLDFIDPEAQFDGEAFPLQRAFSAGFNIKF